MRRNSLSSTVDLAPRARHAVQSDNAWRKVTGSSVILGIDPGTLVTGYGIVARQRNALRLLGSGTVRNPAAASMPIRLKAIFQELCKIIQTYHPDELAIETAFYGKNAQSALKLGHARGVAILAAVVYEIPTTEYSPREVKKALVGTGSASKEQVQYMVKSMLRITDKQMIHDTSDAIAIAICHSHRLLAPASGHRDWRSFITAHPERVKA